jgi:hypothetical protein
MPDGTTPLCRVSAWFLEAESQMVDQIKCQIIFLSCKASWAGGKQNIEGDNVSCVPALLE